MPRRRPTPAVIAPQRDERLRQLGQAIVSSIELPEVLAEVVAEGYLHRLRRCCWSSLSDVLGTGDDVERILAWPGPPRSLSAPLVRLGYLADVNGVLVAADAASEAPEYVKARWRRNGRQQYEAAVRRRTEVRDVRHDEAAGPHDGGPRLLDPWDDATEVDPMSETLFGSVPDEPEGKHVSTPGFTESRDFYHDAYARRHNRRYPWRSADFRYLQLIVRGCESLDECRTVLGLYLDDRRPYFAAGHELRRLLDNLAEFQSRARRAGQLAAQRRELGSKAETSGGGIEIRE